MHGYRVNRVLKFESCEGAGKGVFMIAKEKLATPSITLLFMIGSKNMKEVLKGFHKASPFKGTHLVEEAMRTSNLSESVCMPKINKSIANKNKNYMERIVEVNKDPGDYHFTTFETLKTEQFLLNDPAVELKSHADFLAKHFEISETINSEIDNIVLKVHSQLQKPASDLQLDTLCSIDEDPVPHVLHRSELTASKNIWEASKASPRYVDLVRKHRLLAKVHRRDAAKFADVQCPLVRKLVVALHHENEKIVELLHSIGVSGYIVSPQSGSESASISDSSAPVNLLLSQDILYSMSKTAVSMITFGSEYCVALTSSGTVASWGYGGSGCLGHGNYTSYTSPKLIKELKEDIVYIESGAYHIGAISSKGKLIQTARQLARVGEVRRGAARNPHQASAKGLHGLGCPHTHGSHFFARGGAARSFGGGAHAGAERQGRSVRRGVERVRAKRVG